MKVLINKRYAWYEETYKGMDIYVKGFFRFNGESYSDSSAARKIADLFCMDSPDSYSDTFFKKQLLRLRGHFSFILTGNDFCLAASDRIRSYPVFYSFKKENIAISNDARLVQAENDLFEKDEQSLLEFKMAGYVTGRNTLFKGLKQVQAGEYLFFDQKKKKMNVVEYYRYWSDKPNSKSESEMLEELENITSLTFKDMIETLDGRPVWIPLSGGLDSRLVACMLKSLKYDNLFCFSYGLPRNWESKAGRKIAEQLGLRWHFVPYTYQKCLRLFNTKERRDFFKFADGLCSVPYSQDFYALKELREQKIIPENAIIINGNSGDFISGGHIPEVFTLKNSISFDEFFNFIVDKHYSLWADLKSQENLKILKEIFLESLPIASKNLYSKEEAASAWELWEWQARQTRYVVNLQRGYDFWGYEWRLPLWSEYLMDFWKEITLFHKLNQNLYKKYLYKHNFFNLFKGVDTKKYYYNSLPVIFLKILRKLLFFYDSEEYKVFENVYIRYFTDRVQSRTIYPYLTLIRDKSYKYHRSGISLHAKRYLSEVYGEVF
jgi:asparagine synthase (glutamine-hydrolysing)